MDIYFRNGGRTEKQGTEPNSESEDSPVSAYSSRYMGMALGGCLKAGLCTLGEFDTQRLFIQPVSIHYRKPWLPACAM
jgi:hypothetical protein